jgi:WW domain-containing oxidoreductase
MARRGHGWRIKTVEEGAATTCYVATDPDLAGVRGRYFEDCRIAVRGGHMQDDAMAARLWAVSEELSESYLLPANTYTSG